MLTLNEKMDNTKKKSKTKHILSSDNVPPIFFNSSEAIEKRGIRAATVILFFYRVSTDQLSL